MSIWATWDEVWSQISTFAPAALHAERDTYDIGINDVLTFGYSEDGFWGLVLAVSALMNTFTCMLGYYDETDILGFDIYAAIFYAKSGGVDMAAINAAMMDAEYLEISEFLSINWAYQQIMWDQPFFPEKYTALINEIRT